MRVKQVKQTEYNVKSFLGQEPFTSTERRTKYCVLYLAPGDYHRFHCYNSGPLKQMDLIFKLDEQIGAQGAAILYSAPSWAIDPNCTGFVFGKDVIKGGCAPREDAMDDYEDVRPNCDSV